MDVDCQKAEYEVLRQSLMELRKPVLKEMCYSQLLPVSGTKQELVNRVMESWNRYKLRVGVDRFGGGVSVTITAWRK